MNNVYILTVTCLSAHRQRLVSVKSILSRPNQARYKSTNNRSSSVEHQRRLFEYFLVVSLQKSKASGHYLPEVTQQFPPKVSPLLQSVKLSSWVKWRRLYTVCKFKCICEFVLQLEQSFKLMRETEDRLRSIPLFCFPDAKDWEPVDNFPRLPFCRLLRAQSPNPYQITKLL